MTARELSCVLHVHSTYSDGTATVEEILAAARAAGADCVLLTDHDSLQARRDGWEGWHDGVLLVVGHEISPRDGHLLAFGLDEEVDHRGRTEAELCAEVRARGGFAVAAHPFSQGSRMSARIGRPHPWSALDEPDLGVEVWSMVTDVAERWRTPGEAVAQLRSPEAIDGPPDDHLRRWDALCARRRTVGIGGLDAHERGVRIRDRVVTPTPHRRWFGLLRTQVLVGGELDPPGAVAALREGRCQLALRQLGDPTGFRFGADGVPMGGEAPWNGQVAAATAPRPAGLTLLRDGAPVATAEGERLEHPTDGPGAYRVEARLGGRRWIVSNPVYLR